MSDKTIENEMDAIAENLEKSVTSPIDLIKATVLEMGPAKLKEVAKSLNAEQKGLLREVLEDLAKSRYDAEPEIQYTPNGDSQKNQKKIDGLQFDTQDEVVQDELEEDRQDQHRNQGGVPVEGWEGQVIKSDCQEPLMKESEASGAEGNGKAKDPKKEKKKMDKACMKKSDFVAVLNRMQERGLEKSNCVEKLATATGFEKSKVEAIWDALAKAAATKYDDGTVGKDVPEADQVKPPKELGNDAKAKESKPLAGKPKPTADEGENPPAIKKSESEANEKKPGRVSEDWALTKSKDPFKENSFGKNAHYDVDAYLAEEYVSAFKKSKFDYEADTEMRKSEGLEDLIEKGLDLDPSTFDSALDVTANPVEANAIVKSFSDEEFDEVMNPSHMWSEEK